MPIDYSKWDNLDEYSDSEHEDEASGPRVTRLDAPSRVTFGGAGAGDSSSVEDHQAAGGSAIAIEPQQQLLAASTLPPPSSNQTSEGRRAIVTARSEGATKNTTTENAWISKGGSVVTVDNRLLYWSQDRYSVQIRLELLTHPQQQETIERVQVEGILPYADRHCATGSQKPRLVITGRCCVMSDTDSHQTGTAGPSPALFTMLEGDLPHPVHWSQDDDGEAKSLDWTIERNPTDNDEQRRYVLITLHKAVPMEGLFVWWKRPLLKFDEISLEEGGTERSAASKEFLQAWDEAHRIFRETKRPSPQTRPP